MDWAQCGGGGVGEGAWTRRGIGCGGAWISGPGGPNNWWYCWYWRCARTLAAAPDGAWPPTDASSAWNDPCGPAPGTATKSPVTASPSEECCGDGDDDPFASAMSSREAAS